MPILEITLSLSHSGAHLYAKKDALFKVISFPPLKPNIFLPDFTFFSAMIQSDRGNDVAKLLERKTRDDEDVTIS